MGTEKWTKFWYAVDQLHDWVHGKKTIDTMLLQHFVSAYYHGIKSIYMDDGVLERYENAGLLDEDSDWHKTLFSNFRDKQEHFNLSPDEKEELRDELLSEKARVKQLFQKVHLLKSLEIVDKTTRWIRKLPPTITTEDQFAAAALLDLFAGAPAPDGSADEDAAEQLEDSATDGGGRESDAYSEKRCTKHRMLFKECTDEECKEEVKGFGMHISNDSMEVCTWQKSFLLNNVSVMCPRCCTACES
jgi:hypothetical protein